MPIVSSLANEWSLYMYVLARYWFRKTERPEAQGMNIFISSSPEYPRSAFLSCIVNGTAPHLTVVRILGHFTKRDKRTPLENRQPLGNYLLQIVRKLPSLA
jgi:hypothetical protein